MNEHEQRHSQFNHSKFVFQLPREKTVLSTKHTNSSPNIHGSWRFSVVETIWGYKAMKRIVLYSPEHVFITYWSLLSGLGGRDAQSAVPLRL